MMFYLAVVKIMKSAQLQCYLKNVGEIICLFLLYFLHCIFAGLFYFFY